MTKHRTGRTVKQKTIQRLLQDENWFLDEELSQLVPPPAKVYRHSDGRVLLYHLFPVQGILVQPHESQGFVDNLRAVHAHHLAWVAENPHGRHILVGCLPQGLDFAAQVPVLVAELPGLLRLPPEDLDFSEASLVRIDPALKRIGLKKCTSPPLFPALVAYVGEYLRRRYRGEWRMRQDRDVRVWEPWIVLQNGKACNLATQLHDSLTKYALRVSGIPNLEIGFKYQAAPEFWDPESASKVVNPHTAAMIVLHVTEESEPKDDTEQAWPMHIMIP